MWRLGQFGVQLTVNITHQQEHWWLLGVKWPQVEVSSDSLQLWLCPNWCGCSILTFNLLSSHKDKDRPNPDTHLHIFVFFGLLFSILFFLLNWGIYFNRTRMKLWLKWWEFLYEIMQSIRSISWSLQLRRHGRQGFTQMGGFSKQRQKILQLT